MPDWEDKYAPPNVVPGIAVDNNAAGAGWEDKYLAPNTKPAPTGKVSRSFGILPGMSFEMPAERAGSFDSAGRLGRDVGNSVLLQALSAPGTAINMAGQGAYGAGSHIYDVAKEKGLSNVNADDLKHAAVTGGISSLGPLIGRGISPEIPLKPQNPIEDLSVYIAKHHGMEHVPGEFIDEIGRAGRSDLFKPFVGKEMHKEVPDVIHRIGEGISGAALPVTIGAIAGHQFMDSPILGALMGYGVSHARDIATKNIPAWWNNSAMHAGKFGPMSQAVINQLAREGGSIGADAIKY
jgi:hypothetical protein